MAIFHLSVKPLSRKSGRSSVAAAAYRSGSRLLNQRDGQWHDYTRRGGVDHHEILVPADAPDWARFQESLWSGVEMHDTRANARTAIELELALPHELSEHYRLELTRNFAQLLVDRFGIAVDMAIHSPSRSKPAPLATGTGPAIDLPGGDDRNHHAHLLLTTWTITPDGFGKKVKPFDHSNDVETIRAEWAVHCNATLDVAGVKARIDHRSLEAQGIDRTPGRHVTNGSIKLATRDGVITEEMNQHLAARFAQDLELEAADLHRQAEEAGKLETLAAAPSPITLRDPTYDQITADFLRQHGLDLPMRSVAKPTTPPAAPPPSAPIAATPIVRSPREAATIANQLKKKVSSEPILTAEQEQRAMRARARATRLAEPYPRKEPSLIFLLGQAIKPMIRQARRLLGPKPTTAPLPTTVLRPYYDDSIIVRVPFNELSLDQRMNALRLFGSNQYEVKFYMCAGAIVGIGPREYLRAIRTEGHQVARLDQHWNVTRFTQPPFAAKVERWAIDAPTIVKKPTPAPEPTAPAPPITVPEAAKPTLTIPPAPPASTTAQTPRHDPPESVKAGAEIGPTKNHVLKPVEQPQPLAVSDIAPAAATPLPAPPVKVSQQLQRERRPVYAEAILSRDLTLEQRQHLKLFGFGVRLAQTKIYSVTFDDKTTGLLASGPGDKRNTFWLLDLNETNPKPIELDVDPAPTWNWLVNENPFATKQVTDDLIPD